MKQLGRQHIEKCYDFIVVGGGMTGICAALAAARNGARTALIHERPVLGGNASSEIRLHVCGASANLTKPDLSEGGILHELMLANKRLNDTYNYSIWDAVLFEAVKQEANLTLFLNTTMIDAFGEAGVVQAIDCYQMTTEKRFLLSADFFADCTGNGTLCAFAGAEFRMGREAKSEFNEPHAPEHATTERMGNTLLFIIKEYEEIRDQLVRAIYGVWDHIKNGGDHGAENYSLSWVGMLPGTRESRRIECDYMLTENDILSGQSFADKVAYGGWPIDDNRFGLFAFDSVPAVTYALPDAYDIPYRSYCVKHFKNLYTGGHCMGASRLAMASTRVMGTCAIGGQAIGTAAAILCRQRKLSAQEPCGFLTNML